MENPQTQTSYFHQHRANLILGALILVVGTILVANLMQNNKSLKTSLIPGGQIVQDINLESGATTPRSVELLWNDNDNTNGGFYTGEVSYEVRYFTGEVTSSDLAARWDEFADILYSGSGLQEENGQKKITALGLSPATQYTFGVAKNDTVRAVSHISNALGITTPATGSTSNTVTVNPSGNKNVNSSGGDTSKTLPTSSSSVTKGDANFDGQVTSWDSYLDIMYMYYKNWSAFLVGVKTQGISFPNSMTESKFLEAGDTNGDCQVDFQDSTLISQYANGLINTFPDPVDASCQY